MQLLRSVEGGTTPTTAPTSDARPSTFLTPGRNCWRIEKANRATVLLDGGNYFSALEHALRAARRSILILGWDFDGRIRLRPDKAEVESPPLEDLLLDLAEATPELEIRILIWSLSVVHAPGAWKPKLFGAAWQHHPRIHVKLDTKHPFYAAHHQKVVCVDDAVAFAGGIDLTVRRWDMPAHRFEERARVDPDGNAYPPLHDIQMAVDGEAAAALAELASERWRAATGETVRIAPGEASGWPEWLEPDFTHVDVAIARTQPAYAEAREIKETSLLNQDALRRAERSIYIEAQYMVSPSIGDILEEHLRDPKGPEVIVIMTHESRGFVERVVMGNNRDRLIRRLAKADRFGRLRICFPCINDASGEQQVLVHSKVIIVDDRFLRVGSSNLNDRSIALDTECDLAIVARSASEDRTIRRIRDVLLSEHLGVELGVLERQLSRSPSLVTAIDLLSPGSRGLRRFEAMSDGGPDTPVFGSSFLDPKRPFSLTRLWRR